jgi:argininosuccinate lyase
MENEIQKMKVESINRMSSLVGNLIAEAINYSKIVDRKPILKEANPEEVEKRAGKEILTLKEAAEYMSLSLSYMYKLSH